MNVSPEKQSKANHKQIILDRPPAASTSTYPLGDRFIYRHSIKTTTIARLLKQPLQTATAQRAHIISIITSIITLDHLTQQ